MLVKDYVRPREKLPSLPSGKWTLGTDIKYQLKTGVPQILGSTHGTQPLRGDCGVLAESWKLVIDGGS